MAKATTGHAPVPQTRRTTVHAPKDRALAALLTGTGGLSEHLLNQLATAADPTAGGNTTVTFINSDAGLAAEGLAALLARTPAGTPGRDALAGVAARLGVTEPGQG